MRPIFYDLETTGRDPEQDRIVEIAAYDPEKDNKFCTLVNPNCPIPKGATLIHQITDEMVASSPDFSMAGKQFIEFCSGEVVLIAHNNDKFDKIFLERGFQQCHIPIPSWPYIDSYKWAKKYRSDLPKFSLQRLREYFKIPANQAHRALNDVLILAQVFSFLTDDLSIDQVLKLSQESKTLNHMPFGKYQGTPLSKLPKNYILWLSKNGILDKPENEPLYSSFVKQGLLKK